MKAVLIYAWKRLSQRWCRHDWHWLSTPRHSSRWCRKCGKVDAEVSHAVTK